MNLLKLNNKKEKYHIVFKKEGWDDFVVFVDDINLECCLVNWEKIELNKIVKISDKVYEMN
jgi:hypothetical protein